MNPGISKKEMFWLHLGFWAVIGYAVFQLGTALIGITLFPAYARLHAESYVPNQAWTSGQTQAALQELGWPANSVGWVNLGLDILSLGVGYSLGFIILRKKSRDGFGLLLAFVFLMSGNTGTVLQPAIARLPALDYFFNNVIGVVSWQLFFITLFLFPNGKLVPSWSRWVIMVWLGYMLWSLLNPNSVDHPLMWLSFALVFCALGSQVYRQWKQPDPVQRQQIKWVVFAIVVAAVIIGYLGLAGFKPPSDQGYAKDLMIALLQQVVFFLMFMLVMVAILIAIIRYRLYDIDLIIRRTLQYSVLTALLGLIYFGSVVLGQRLAGALTGSPDSPVVLVISTLLIAALFNPLRARVQDFIDRRFYRRKYDALQTLADFTKTARDETQLEVLKPALLEAVQDSVQPEQAWLWLKPKRRG